MKTKPWHIIFIDDNPEDRADLRQMLLQGSDRRYCFDEAELGGEGLRKIRAQQDPAYDCVLLDYHLCDMNAEELLLALCDASGLTVCPVVVVTGSYGREGKQLIRAGAQDYIGKDWITPASLTRVVENAIERFALAIHRTDTEKALRKSEELLAQGVHVAGLAIAEVDYNTGLNHLSAEAAKMFGLGEVAIAVPRATLHATFHPDDYETMQVKIAESLDPNGLGWFHLDHRVVWPDGQVRWLRVRKHINFIGNNSNRRPDRATLVALDITESKLQVLAQKQVDQRARLALDAGQLGDWHWDATTDLVTLGSRAAAIFGFPNKATVTRAQMRERFLSPDTALQANLAWNKALVEQTDYFNEYQINHPVNGNCWIAVTGRGSYADNGTLLGMNGVMQDISGRKNAESKLLDAVAAAEKANRAKSEFLSRMSHELRTPLNAILGFAQLVESGKPPPTESQLLRLQEIIKAGWYLLDLINEILDLALIESGKLLLSLEAISLTHTLQECLAMIDPKAQQQGISLSLNKCKENDWVFADHTRFKQVLLNLLSNAVKYNRPGGSVSVDCSMSSADKVRISITDSGAGLSAEKITQLFQPFNRLGQEHGKEEGTGIGLMVSKRLVELMGGEIGVNSSMHVGSVFWIELPKDHSTAVNPDLSQASTQERQQTQSIAGLHTLLYVEDNPANLLLLEQIIADHSPIRLISAHNGNLGIDLARAHLPDVILMDINLPGINGLQALKILRADPATTHIPIIALSANALPRDIENGLQAGFFRYLTKPIKVAELLNTLDEALSHRADGLQKAS